jgi:hypothetical protein
MEQQIKDRAEELAEANRDLEKANALLQFHLPDNSNTLLACPMKLELR